MRIHNLYEDEHGVSHWRDIEVEWAQTTATGHLSAPIKVSALIFRDTNPDYDLDWHPAPRRQYIINLDGGVKLTASDGEARVIGAGEVILVEDVSGKGHLSQSVENKLRHSIFVPIEPV
jgi:carbonic anhydrase